MSSSFSAAISRIYKQAGREGVSVKKRRRVATQGRAAPSPFCRATSAACAAGPRAQTAWPCPRPAWPHPSARVRCLSAARAVRTAHVLPRAHRHQLLQRLQLGYALHAAARAKLLALNSFLQVPEESVALEQSRHTVSLRAVRARSRLQPPARGGRTSCGRQRAISKVISPSAVLRRNSTIALGSSTGTTRASRAAVSSASTFLSRRSSCAHPPYAGVR